MNRKLRKDLNIYDDQKFGIKRDIYEINREFYEPSFINTYRNLYLKIEKYKGREEGAYEMMYDNLNYYAELYNNPLTDGNINMFINGNDKIKDIKEIILKEKNLLIQKLNI